MKECRPSQVLFDYIQKELPRDQMSRIEAHLSHCAACRDELDRLRQQIQQVRTTIALLESSQSAPAMLLSNLKRLPAHPVPFTPVPHLSMALSAAVVLILCLVSLFNGKQSVLANSISQLKVIMDVSAILNRATSMDCSVLKSNTGSEDSFYRIRWNKRGITRVDRESSDGVQQTLWISDTTVPPDMVWQPAMEFLTPAILAGQMEGPYGLMRTGQWDGAGRNEFLLIGRDKQQVIEIAIDEKTYLPGTLRKYLLEPGKGNARKCVLEARFSWNRPLPEELLIPRPAAGKQQLNH